MDNLASLPITMCLSKVTLAAGTTSTMSTTGTTVYCINGKAYSKGAITNQATPTTDIATGLAFIPVKTNQGSIFLIGFNAAGTLLCSQGSVTALDSAGNFIVAPQMGLIVDNFCPIGYLVIQAGSTASAAGWVFGTGNQASVTGITYTIQDLISVPARPQVS